MKKLVLLIVTFVSISLAAQNVQLHYDLGKDRKYLTSTVEMFKVDNWGNTFFFVDMDYSAESGGVGLGYWEIAREIKLWKAPFAVHVEYNGGMNKAVGSFGNAYLVGPSYTNLAKDFSGSFTIMALYKNIRRTDEPNSFQITAVWNKNLFKNKVTISGFADFWREKHTVSNDGFVSNFKESKFIFLSEPQFWYNFTKNISLGSEIELSSDFGGVSGFWVRPTLAAKWNF